MYCVIIWVVHIEKSFEKPDLWLQHIVLRCFLYSHMVQHESPLLGLRILIANIYYLWLASS